MMPPRALYRLFPWAGRASNWIEHRFAAGGRLLLGLFICGVLFGIDMRQTLAYQVAALAFALLVTSVILSLRWRPRLRIRRILPELVTAGLPMSYYLEVSNSGSRVERDLCVLDQLVSPPIGYDAFQTRRADGGQRRRNWFDRAVGFPRWVEMRRRARGAEIDLAALPAIAPGASVRVRIDTEVVRRGWLHFQRSDILRPDPLGLFRARVRIEHSESLLSLPRRYPAPRIQLRSERRYQKGGVSLAHAVGDSQEFAALRDYRSGDPRRHIHWRTFARTGKLIVKQYQDEYFDRHALVIDTHVAAGAETLFEAIISVAASIAGGERPRDSILDLIFVGADIVRLSAGRGLGDATHALTYLAEAQPAPLADFDQMAGVLRARADELASVIVVLGADDRPRRDLLTALTVRGIPCIALFVTVDDTAPADGVFDSAPEVFTIRAGYLAEDLAAVELDRECERGGGPQTDAAWLGEPRVAGVGRLHRGLARRRRHGADAGARHRLVAGQAGHGQTRIPSGRRSHQRLCRDYRRAVFALLGARHLRDPRRCTVLLFSMLLAERASTTRTIWMSAVLSSFVVYRNSGPRTPILHRSTS